MIWVGSERRCAKDGQGEWLVMILDVEPRRLLLALANAEGEGGTDAEIDYKLNANDEPT